MGASVAAGAAGAAVGAGAAAGAQAANRAPTPAALLTRKKARRDTIRLDSRLVDMLSSSYSYLSTTLFK
jgi:hypothetical protein